LLVRGTSYETRGKRVSRRPTRRSRPRRRLASHPGVVVVVVVVVARLYHWLQANMDTTSHIYTHERANKLVLAFGDRWQSECFTKSIWAW